MQDPPAAEELVAVVAEFLRAELLPVLEGRLAFDARVAANVLDIVARELRLGPAAVADEGARLAALLGAEGDVAALDRRLCERLREGAMSLATPGLVEHVRATALDRLAIDQPGYATYRRIRERGWGSVPADIGNEEAQG